MILRVHYTYLPCRNFVNKTLGKDCTEDNIEIVLSKFIADSNRSQHGGQTITSLIRMIYGTKPDSYSAIFKSLFEYSVLPYLYNAYDF